MALKTGDDVAQTRISPLFSLLGSLPLGLRLLTLRTLLLQKPAAPAVVEVAQATTVQDTPSCIRASVKARLNEPWDS